MIQGQPYRVVWVMNTATGDRLPLQNAYQRGLVDTSQRLFFDEKLNRQSYSFEKAVELGYMGIEPDTASLPIHVDGIDYMIHWVLDSSTKRRIFPRPAVRKNILDAVHGRYVNPYNNSQVSLHEAIYLKFIGATEYNSNSDSLTVTINGQSYNIRWVYDTRHMKKILPRDALKQGVLDIQLNEYRKFDTNDVMSIYDAIQAGYIRCSDDDSSSDNSIRPPSIISVDEDELTIATKTATYVITSVIHPLTQKEIKVSEAIDLGILDKEIGTSASRQCSLKGLESGFLAVFFVNVLSKEHRRLITDLIFAERSFYCWLEFPVYVCSERNHLSSITEWWYWDQQVCLSSFERWFADVSLNESLICTEKND